jgi:hypothetical protein
MRRTHRFMRRNQAVGFAMLSPHYETENRGGSYRAFP